LESLLNQLKKICLCKKKKKKRNSYFGKNRWHGNLIGQPKTKYTNRIFHFILKFTESYPYRAPTITTCDPNKYCGYKCHEILYYWDPSFSVMSILIQLQSDFFVNFELDTKNSKKYFKCDSCPHNLSKKIIWPESDYLYKKTMLYLSIDVENAWNKPLILEEVPIKKEKKILSKDWRKKENIFQLIKSLKENTEIFSDSIFIGHIFPFISRTDLIEMKSVSISWEMMINEHFNIFYENIQQCSITKEPFTNCTIGYIVGIQSDEFIDSLFCLVSKEVYIDKESSNNKDGLQGNIIFMPLFINQKYAPIELFKQNFKDIHGDIFDELKILNDIELIFTHLIKQQIGKIISFHDFLVAFLSFYRWIIFLMESNPKLELILKNEYKEIMKDSKKIKNKKHLILFLTVDDLNLKDYLELILGEFLEKSTKNMKKFKNYKRASEQYLLWNYYISDLNKLTKKLILFKIFKQEIKNETIRNLSDSWNGIPPEDLKIDILSLWNTKIKDFEEFYSFLNLNFKFDLKNFIQEKLKSLGSSNCSIIRSDKFK